MLTMRTKTTRHVITTLMKACLTSSRVWTNHRNRRQVETQQVNPTLMEPVSREPQGQGEGRLPKGVAEEVVETPPPFFFSLEGDSISASERC